MHTFQWQPRCERPSTLVPAVRVGSGPGAPSRSAVRGRQWRSCGPGLYVPASAVQSIVEQRILEQAARVGPRGGLTAWAALRWYGAAYFDGTGPRGELLPVPLLVAGKNIRGDARCAPSWEQFAPSERRVVAGVPCATPQRALFDEMHRTGSLRDAVVAMDMAAAARLISVGLMGRYVVHRRAWTGVPLVRAALALATDDSRSPQESRMRLVWCIDAGLPAPYCNRPVFSPDGALIGIPDMLDPEAGLAVEYDGADHLLEDRRKKDLEREAAFRDHGLEYLAVVRGMMSERVRLAGRMGAARRRAQFAPSDRRRWTLEPPAWFDVPETLDEQLVRECAADRLSHP